MGYGIASVFTPPGNRRKGFARHMMGLLHWVLAPHASLPSFPPNWGKPPPEVVGLNNAAFSALYSDIGDFYLHAGPDGSSDGWVIRDPMSTIWSVPEEPLEAVADVKWLDEDELHDLWVSDTEMIFNDLKTSDSNKILVSYLPDNGVANFLVRRTLYFLPGLTYKKPTKWGAVLQDHEATFTTWTLDVSPPPPTLIVTRLRATPETFPRLLAATLMAAKENNMKKIEIWNLPKELADLAQNLGGVTETRSEHLNAIKWYGPEKNEEVEWLNNEKYVIGICKQPHLLIIFLRRFCWC